MFNLGQKISATAAIIGIAIVFLSMIDESMFVLKIGGITTGLSFCIFLLCTLLED
jgi:hypothetical protein